MPIRELWVLNKLRRESFLPALLRDRRANSQGTSKSHVSLAPIYLRSTAVISFSYVPTALSLFIFYFFLTSAPVSLPHSLSLSLPRFLSLFFSLVSLAFVYFARSAADREFDRFITIYLRGSHDKLQRRNIKLNLMAWLYN